MATYSSILALRIPWAGKPGGYSPRGHKESSRTERLPLSLFHMENRLMVAKREDR